MKKQTCRSQSFKALMVTQFLGAFNDNAFKVIVTLYAVSVFTTVEASNQFVSLLGALFILPFILFSTYAGFCADYFGKRVMIISAKVAELCIMIAACVSLLTGSLWAMSIVLFFLATQSAFFGPAKYGILPEMLKDEELSRGNGYIQMWTFVAIILGTAFAGFLSDLFHVHIIFDAIFLIVFAVLGIAASLTIKSGHQTFHERTFEINFVKDACQNLRQIKKVKGLYLTAFAIAYFWFFGAVFQMNAVLYAKNILSLGDGGARMLLAIASIGIGCGSVFAGKVSEGKIEFGLVPLGALGMSLFGFLLGLEPFTIVRAALYLFALGMSAGLFIVPLNAYFQKQSPQEKRGKFLGSLNIITACAILVGSLFLWVLGTKFSFSAAQIFFMLGVTSVFATVYVFKTLPNAFLRFMNWIITHTLYRIKVIGISNIPSEGGALLVCNHVSYVDPPLVLSASERSIRFLMFREMYEKPFIKPVAKIMKSIPVSLNDQPKAMMAALQEARNAVEAGELVCIFAEGALTRTGNMLPFSRGFEHIMKGLGAPIIPVHIDQIWGSIFSYRDGKFFWKMPRMLPYPVTVNFGEALPADSKAYQVRARVQELGAEAFQYRKAHQQKLPCAFIDEVKKHPFKFAMADATKQSLTYVQALTSMLVLSNKLFSEKKAENQPEKVGVLFPASCVGSLVNGAVFFAGKIPVNLNFTASQESIESAITQCDMQRIITSRTFIEKAKIEANDMMLFIEDIISTITRSEKMLCFLSALLLPRFLLKRFYVRGERKNIEDVATIIFSSGSTGEPKGVLLTHANIFSNIEGLYQVFRLQKNDVIMGVLPFFHSFGFTATMCFPLGTGIGVVYHANPMDAGMIGKLVKRHRATILMGTPTFLSAYVRKCTDEQFQSLRYAVAGAEKLKESLAQAFIEKFRIVPFEGYGATELSPIVSMGVHTPDLSGEKSVLVQVGHKSGKVGHPIPGVAVKIVDQETGELLPFGHEGILLVKGQNVMKGYLHNDEKTQEVIQNGWYITGDIACIDDDGFIQITDRLSRFSKIGGEMVPHIKIEEELAKRVDQDAVTCVVSAVPDERKGERLVVLYTGDFSVETVWKGLNETDMPKLWIPKKEDFYMVEEIPLLGSGKFDLKLIKQLALAKVLGEV